MVNKRLKSWGKKIRKRRGDFLMMPKVNIMRIMKFQQKPKEEEVYSKIRDMVIERLSCHNVLKTDTYIQHDHECYFNIYNSNTGEPYSKNIVSSICDSISNQIKEKIYQNKTKPVLIIDYTRMTKSVIRFSIADL
jgi:hypothetical protein